MTFRSWSVVNQGFTIFYNLLKSEDLNFFYVSILNIWHARSWEDLLLILAIFHLSDICENEVFFQVSETPTLIVTLKIAATFIKIVFKASLNFLSWRTNFT